MVDKESKRVIFRDGFGNEDISDISDLNINDLGFSFLVWYPDTTFKIEKIIYKI